ncbi:MAG: ATP-binding protein [Anaerolineae bacterium]
MSFVDRDWELAALERFWASGRAQLIPVTGRRRVGKTYLLERFAAGKHAAYYRCRLTDSNEQLALLGQALADLSGDAVLAAQPPSAWPAVLALIASLAQKQRLLLVLDELPYWAARDQSLPSVLQNWWDESGRTLDLMLVICGSAVQMMESLLTGPAPLAGCVTGRVPVRPLDFRAAHSLVGFADAADALTAYGILGGVPLYLLFFRQDLSIRENILQAIASPSARLYVEPQALFADAHRSFEAGQALTALRAIAWGRHRWSEIADATGLNASSLTRVMDPLMGDLALVERVLPVTEGRESRTYHTQYRLTDNFLRFWFRFIEPNQGQIEFGSAAAVVDGIMARLPEFMGPAFESMARQWTRLAGADLPVPPSRVGSWWVADHQLDVVGLDQDGQAVVTGEAKWHNRPFSGDDLRQYLEHAHALGARLRPDVTHLLFSKSGFAGTVTQWAAETRARLLTPETMLRA